MYGGPRGPPTEKRFRPEGPGLLTQPPGGFAPPQQAPGAPQGQGYPPPSQQNLRASKVVRAKGLPDNVLESDLLDCCTQFGNVAYVSVVARGAALVEFEQLRSAEECVNYSMMNQQPLLIHQQPVMFNFAQMDSIPRKGYESDVPTNTLVCEITNVRYPISTDVIAAICKPVALPNRIKIVRSGGIQAFIEFETPQMARDFKHRLNGCDIYSGCCTLKIDFAIFNRLRVSRNDQDEWDYVGVPGRDRGGLLNEPAYPPQAGSQQGYDELGYDRAGRPIYEQGPEIPGMGQDPLGKRSYDNFAGAAGAPGFPRAMAPTQYGFEDEPQQQQDVLGPRADGSGFDQPNSVIMIYGLVEDKWNCDVLHNLLCLYGNVMRIKFLRSKTDAAMVQMGDTVAAQRAIDNLNQIRVFGKQLQVTASKKPYLDDPQGRNEPHQLQDSTPSFKDFRTSKCNRFTTPESAAKNRVCPPNAALYAFNFPTDMTDEKFKELHIKHSVEPPTKIRLYQAREGTKSAAGLLEYEDEEQAVEVIAIMNHARVDSPTSKAPFFIKFAFAGKGEGAPRYDGGGGGGVLPGGPGVFRGAPRGAAGHPVGMQRGGFRGGRGGAGAPGGLPPMGLGGDFQGASPRGGFTPGGGLPRGGSGGFRGRGRGAGPGRGGF